MNATLNFQEKTFKPSEELNQFLSRYTADEQNLMLEILPEIYKMGNFETRTNTSYNYISMITRNNFVKFKMAGQNGVIGTITLNGKFENISCFHKIMYTAPMVYDHYFKIHTIDDLTPELLKFIEMAYEYSYQRKRAIKQNADFKRVV